MKRVCNLLLCCILCRVATAQIEYSRANEEPKLHDVLSSDDVNVDEIGIASQNHEAQELEEIVAAPPVKFFDHGDSHGDDQERHAILETEAATPPSQAAPSNSHKRHQQRIWGHHYNNTDNDQEAQALPSTLHSSNDGNKENKERSNNGENNKKHLPFVSNARKMAPPDGYHIDARVYIDAKDGQAKFDHDVMLPYWDCGATGSTTNALLLSSLKVRHVAAHSTSSVCAHDDDNTHHHHPVLLIALSPTLLELNSNNASMILQPGQTLLLEDVLRPGHQLRPHGNQDLLVMFLTLPHAHNHVGKQHLSIPRAVLNNPCKVDDNGQHGNDHGHRHRKSLLQRALATADDSRASIMDKRRWQTAVLTIVGTALSTVVTDWLGKVAPLWLAVGVGGTCFVAGSTYTFVQAGLYLLQQLELYQWRKMSIKATATADAAASAADKFVTGASTAAETA